MYFRVFIVDQNSSFNWDLLLMPLVDWLPSFSEDATFLPFRAYNKEDLRTRVRTPLPNNELITTDRARDILSVTKLSTVADSQPNKCAIIFLKRFPKVFFPLLPTYCVISSIKVLIFFLLSCRSTRDHIGRSTGNSNPVMTSSTSGAKGCSDHRFCGPPAYTA